MDGFKTLEQHLEAWAGDDPKRSALAKTVLAISDTSLKVSDMIALGAMAGSMGQVVGDNADGDAQKQLDVVANEMFIEALRDTAVGPFGSEENEAPFMLREDGTLAVAMDPLDGSSNIDTNVSVGTIFSVYPAQDGPPEASLLQPGTCQLAGGFVIYGPQTSLVLTLGEGTQIFTVDRSSNAYYLCHDSVQVVTGKREYAINASNYNYWEKPLQDFIDHCISEPDQKREGGRFNMRWIASLVAESYRILARGGIFLYPRDMRPGYQNGRLRLMYEANPIAMLIEQAGGAATDGVNRIMEITPTEFHQRVPFIFGDHEKVTEVGRYHTEPHAMGERSPLFGRRGLFRA